MMRTLRALTLAIIVATCGGLSVNAAPVVWDYSPDAMGSTSGQDFYTNQTFGQNFLERFVLASDTQLGGMAIYMATAFGNVGNTTTIKLYSDAGAAPGSLITSFTETVSVVDNEGTLGRPGAHRVFAAFTNSLNLLAGSYYIGMSGTSTTFTQSALQSPTTADDGRMWQLNGNTTSPGFVNIGDMAFRLYGTEASVPLPGALTLLGIGLLGLGLRRRTV